MPKDGKDKSKDKSTTSKPTASQGDGDSDIEEEQIKVYEIAACFVLQVQFCTPETALLKRHQGFASLYISLSTMTYI
jgi:hypothetical protein